jgi:hypothetical protein
VDYVSHELNRDVDFVGRVGTTPTSELAGTWLIDDETVAKMGTQI